ncbi:uncharacterized protein METZ01_LOCUS497405, partial [marine metagenome]
MGILFEKTPWEIYLRNSHDSHLGPLF